MTKLLITFICFIFFSAQAHALDINDVRFGVHSDKTRVVIELSQASKFRTFMLPEIKDKPYRLVVDMPDFNWKAGTISRPANTNVLDVRSGTLQKGIKRLVIDLSKPAKIKTAFILPADQKRPNRLVIDYSNISLSQFKTTQRKPIGNLNIETFKTSQPKTSVPKQSVVTPQKAPPKSPLRKQVIVIDAGHGGADPGAIGAGKQKEKTITLSAAHLLKKRLENTGRYTVHMTRDNDTYIKLYKRRQIAREKEADLFISLHADSINKPNVSGASIYTLSNKASDAQTAKLAARENQSDLIAGVDLSHEDKDVANILLDLAMRDTMNQSKFFANIVVDNMKNRGIRVLTRPHRYAGFAVLKAPDTPSVLFEMGFMSNKKEAQLLSSSRYQTKIAAALTDSIDDYFKKVSNNNR